MKKYSSPRFDFAFSLSFFLPEQRDGAVVAKPVVEGCSAQREQSSFVSKRDTGVARGEDGIALDIHSLGNSDGFIQRNIDHVT